MTKTIATMSLRLCQAVTRRVHSSHQVPRRKPPQVIKSQYPQQTFSINILILNFEGDEEAEEQVDYDEATTSASAPTSKISTQWLLDHKY